MGSRYAFTTTGPVAYDIRSAFEKGDLRNVTAIEEDDSDDFRDAPAGLEPLITLIVSFSAQTAASLTVEIVKRLLIEGSRIPPSRGEKIIVKQLSDDDEPPVSPAS